MSMAETILLIGGFAVMGWYVVTYVLPNLPQGGQFTEGGSISGSTSAAAGGAGNCTQQPGGGSCWRSASCKTSPNPAGRGKTVSWCNKGGCVQARDAWLTQFKCVGSTPKPPAATKVTNCPGKSGNCNWDCKNAYCWTGIACGKTYKTCTSQGQSTNRTTGCNVARNRFLGAYGNCGNSSVPYSQPPPKGTPGLNCTCGAGYVRDIAGTNASRCVCKLKPKATSGNCAGLVGATLNACIAAHS